MNQRKNKYRPTLRVLLRSYIGSDSKEMQMIWLIFIVIVVAFVLATDHLSRSDVNRFLSEHVQNSVATLKTMNS